jgi:hypothetical protein
MDANEKKRVQEERARILKNRVAESKVVDPTVKVTFQNIEDPPSASRPSPPLSFTYGRYIFKESREEGEPDTALRDGHTYDLPMSVVQHLNSLKVPVYGHEVDPVTKALKTVIRGYQRRFSCVPAELMESVPAARKTPAKSKSKEKDPLE